MNFKKTLPALLVASTALILHSVANAEADRWWCGWHVENILGKMKLRDFINNNPEEIVACMKAGADPNENTAASRAVFREAKLLERVKQWLKAAVDHRGKFHGITHLLAEAAIEDSAEAVKLLLEAGADPNAKDSRGRTPLYWAERAGSAEAVKLLRRAGARE